MQIVLKMFSELDNSRTRSRSEMTRSAIEMGSTSPPNQLISAGTMFSVQPTVPPSSPPPAPPLPPLPENALSIEQLVSLPLKAKDRDGKPVRPPRPHSTLPNIKPRIITSPPLPSRKRPSKLAVPVKFSPISRNSPVVSFSEGQEPMSPKYRNSTKLHTSIPRSTFSDDILLALPRIFQCSPQECIDAPVVPPKTCLSVNGGLSAWQVYHESPTNAPSKPKSRRTDTKKPIARTALFIPCTQTSILFPSPRDPLPTHHQPCNLVLMRSTVSVSSPLQTSLTLASPTLPKKLPQTFAPKTSHANTIFASDFGDHHRATSVDDIASLPRLPQGTPAGTKIESEMRYSAKRFPHECRSELHENENRTSKGGAASFFLPYAHTLHLAEPEPRTNTHLKKPAQDSCTKGYSINAQCKDAHVSSRLTSVHFQSIDPELKKETCEPTEEEKRKDRRKKLIWALATISLVLMATAGILGSIIWKLENIASRTQHDGAKILGRRQDTKTLT